MKYVDRLKYTSENPLFRGEKNRYGDIYRITYFSKFKIPTPPYITKMVDSSEKSIRMFALGDSYIAHHIQAKNFFGVDTLIFSNWIDSVKSYELDSTKHNILIIETTERTFIPKFSDRNKLKLPFQNGYKVSSVKKPVRIADYLFNKNINDNLEFTLFDNPPFTYLKELRANSNYYLFNYIPTFASISSDERWLFLRASIDTNFNMPTELSSFKSVNDSILKLCIENCNYINQYYKNLGFKDIYFSFIPNPVTVVGYSNYKYNNLLNMIEESSLREFKTINMYPSFLKHKEEVYLKADSHWTPEGLQMWIDSVNTRLKKDGYVNSDL